MDQPKRARAIVVGIDGSKAAVTAAEWALDEAISRTVPLRLVYVVGAEDDGYPPEMDYAEEALRLATAAVHVGGEAVKVDTAILSGDVDSVLLHESQAAAMICIGSVGIGRVASRLFGSTAVALATGAHCPVAVIRRDREASEHQSITVVVDDHPGNDHVIHQAIEEARLRKSPLLALGVSRWDLSSSRHDELGQRMVGWQQRYPDVQVRVCEAPGGAVEYLVTRNETTKLLVTGGTNAEQLMRFIGPHSHPVHGHPARSVLVIPRPKRVP